MAEPSQPSSAIPVAPILQRKRAELRVELDIAGASIDALIEVDKLVDSIIAETLVITAAELLRADASSVGDSLTSAQLRLLPGSYTTKEEWLSRVSGDASTRAAVEAGFHRLRDLLTKRSDRVQPAPPPTPAPKPTVLALTAPAIQAMFPQPGRRLRGEVRTFVLCIVSVLLLLLLMVMALRSFTQPA